VKPYPNSVLTTFLPFFSEIKSRIHARKEAENFNIHKQFDRLLQPGPQEIKFHPL